MQQFDVTFVVHKRDSREVITEGTVTVNSNNYRYGAEQAVKAMYEGPNSEVTIRWAFARGQVS